MANQLKWSIILITAMVQIAITYTADTSTLVQGNFKLCDLAQRRLLSKNLNCDFVERNSQSKVPKPWIILSKQAHKIQGHALTCEVHEVTISATYTFWGDQYRGRTEKALIVTPIACQSMFEKKDCYGNAMSCIGDVCEFASEPLAEFKWYTTQLEKIFKCKVSKHLIIGDSERDVVAVGVNGNCYAGDLQCRLPNGIMVWDRDVVKSCQYTFLEEAYFNQNGIFIYANSIPFSMNKSEANYQSGFNLIFQLLPSIEVCDKLIVTPTKEGLYVTQDQKAHKLQKKTFTYDNFKHLILSEIDFQAFKTNYELLNQDKKALTAHCHTVQLITQQIKQPDGTLMTIRDLKNDELVIYFDNNNVFVPKCRTVNQIYILYKTEACYEDVPVVIDVKEGKTAFLARNGLLKSTSRQVTCSDSISEININDQYFVRTKGSTTTVSAIDMTMIYKWNPLEIRSRDLSFEHDKNLLSNEDLVYDRDRIDSILDSTFKFVIDTPQLKQQNIFNRFGMVFDSLSDYNHKFFLFIYNLFISICILCLVSFIGKWLFEKYEIKQKILDAYFSQQKKFQEFTRGFSKVNETDV